MSKQSSGSLLSVPSKRTGIRPSHSSSRISDIRSISSRAPSPALTNITNSKLNSRRSTDVSRLEQTVTMKRQDSSANAEEVSRPSSRSSEIAIAVTRPQRSDSTISESERNIHVVVRCRGRNDREIKENSGVAISVSGSKEITVQTGPLTLSNKTYSFDKVFGPEADQSMIYDNVVSPILEEALSGYNCTIFAYGQTGTGKT